MKPESLIKTLATGVPGLDAVLGGGVPEFSFNLITGPPGSGKSTLAHHLLFAMASRERPALFFTALGEPPLKMLRYQQQFAFFDPDRIDDTVRFVNLADEAGTGDLAPVLQRIVEEVDAHGPALVFVDSFRSILRDEGRSPTAGTNAQDFLHQLGVQLNTRQITSFLVSELEATPEPQALFTVADGLLALKQSVYRNTMVRKLQVLKLRGQASSPGIHTFRITGDGIEVFPSACMPQEPIAPSGKRLAMGTPGLDAMLGGGLPSGYSLLVVGPSGSGKTVLGTAFLSEGVRQGEPGVLVAFEQTPSRSWDRTIQDLVDSGQLGLINTRTLDLSIDEIIQRLVETIQRLKATRVVIDSLSGFELAVAPTFREDFRESLFRMVSVLAGLGVTVLMTCELEDRYTELRFSPYGAAFLTDAIIVQRYVELDGNLGRVMAVVKVRSSEHSKEIRAYEITSEGLHLGEALPGCQGLLTGHPTQAGVLH